MFIWLVVATTSLICASQLRSSCHCQGCKSNTVYTVCLKPPTNGPTIITLNGKNEAPKLDDVKVRTGNLFSSWHMGHGRHGYHCECEAFFSQYMANSPTLRMLPGHRYHMSTVLMTMSCMASFGWGFISGVSMMKNCPNENPIIPIIHELRCNYPKDP